MSKLESLKIDDAPLAFASFAAKHNALVDLLSSMEGQNGITVIVAERNAIIRSNISSTSGAAVSVVGNDGKLNLVPKHATWVTPTTYPVFLQTVQSNVTCTMYAAGIQVSGPSYGFYFDPTGPLFSIFRNGGNSVQIDPSSGVLTHSMSIKEIDICDSGTPRKMLVLGSAPY